MELVNAWKGKVPIFAAVVNVFFVVFFSLHPSLFFGVYIASDINGTLMSELFF